MKKFLNSQERKQDEIHAWVKEKKDKGLTIKAGFGKIFYNNTWVRWEDRDRIEKILKEIEKRATPAYRNGQKQAKFCLG